jgi:hypothetical protein
MPVRPADEGGCEDPLLSRPAWGVSGVGRRPRVEQRRRLCGRWRWRVLVGVLVRAGGRETTIVVRVQGLLRALAHQIWKVRSYPPYGSLLPDGGGASVLLVASSDADRGLVVHVVSKRNPWSSDHNGGDAP